MYFKPISYCLCVVILGVLLVQVNAQAALSNHSLAGNAQGDDSPPWMEAIGKRHQQLIEINGPGTNAALRDQLLVMLALDQQVRNDMLERAQSAKTQPDVTVLRPVDSKLTGELKEMIARNGWPTIRLVGFDASNAAMVVLIHSEDHDWQRGLLASLQQLADEDKIDGSQFAMLLDKELIADGKLQRYGTQFKVQDSHLAMYAVMDSSHLDERRALAMLPPMDVYKQMLVSAYSMPMKSESIEVPAVVK